MPRKSNDEALVVAQKEIELNSVTDRALDRLANQPLQKTLAENLRHLQAVVVQTESLNLVAWWEVGHVLQEMVDSAKYGTQLQIMTEASEKLRIDRTILYVSRQFYKFQQTTAGVRKLQRLNLSWTHWRILMGLKEPAVRMQFAAQTVKEGLATTELGKLVAKYNAAHKKTPKGEALDMKKAKNRAPAYFAKLSEILDAVYNKKIKKMLEELPVVEAIWLDETKTKEEEYLEGKKQLMACRTSIRTLLNNLGCVVQLAEKAEHE